MASITFDGQSFIIDGRRLWLVGGTIHYARHTRDQWAPRIHAAKMAGLNTITTSVVWARHEMRAGQFDFTGDNDLRHFVQLVQQAGMLCVLRLGPFIDSGFDFGGMPPWVQAVKDVKVRTQNQPFLEAASRFINAVAKQVRDLQVTNPQHPGDTVGGPIVLVQSEHHWTCGNEQLAHGYLAELYRYIHESGFEVPIVNSNNLWQGVEGEVDGWIGNTQMISTVRQLAAVRPDQPRLVVQFDISRPAAWGEDLPTALDGNDLQRGLMEILAGAGQFNIEPFSGGTNFAFSAGRLADGPARFTTTSSDQLGPVNESGARGELFEPLRRVATFASRFARVLAHLDPRRPAVSLHPGVNAAPGKGRNRGGAAGLAGASSHAVIHTSGSQGSVVFVFAGRGNEESAPATLLLADGTHLPVHLGSSPVAWCLLDTRLHGRSHLDYCNLSAFALVGRVFVAFGPAGVKAQLSINGSPVEVEVPSGDTPGILEHENIILVIAGEHQLPRIQVTDDAVYLNAVDIAAGGNPYVESEKDVVTRILSSGEVVKNRVGDKPPAPPALPPPPVEVKPVKGKKPPAPKPVRKGTPVPVITPPPPPVPRPPVLALPPHKTPKTPELSLWTGASLSDYVEGTSARFASIAGPTELAALGAPYGYGWYRLHLKPRNSGRVNLSWPEAADRIHLFSDGKYLGLLGRGPGAEHEMGVTLKKGEQMLVVLCENAGRFSGGAHTVDIKGLVGHAMETAPVRIARPTLEHGEGVNMLSPLAPPTPHNPPTPLPGVHEGDLTEPGRVTWTLGKRKHPLIIRLSPTAFRGMILVNDTPVRYFDNAGPSTLIVGSDKLQRQNNTIQMAILHADAEAALPALADAVTFEECLDVLTEDADWGFAKWERPAESLYKALRDHSHGKSPEWFKASFTAPAAPVPGHGPALWFVTTGLSKGQLYVNGKHVGRYFSTTESGKPVGPQTELLIPQAALKPGESNDITVFDEHGHLPSRTRLVYR